MDKIIILDFGGQYAHLIARRIRNLGYYSEIELPSINTDKFSNVKGIILSGGPSSVYNKNAPEINKDIFNLNIPILGLCYGHQLMLQHYGGKVKKAETAEFGFSILNQVKSSPLTKNIKFPTQVWMSHQDAVVSIPNDFEIIGSTKDCKFAAVHNINKKRFSLQFHAEVKDTIAGNDFLKNFIKICKIKKNWDNKKLLKNIKDRIKKEAIDKKVLVFLSGGVDSSVAFALLVKVLGSDRVLGLYINNGFMRENETEIIKKRYKKAGFKNIIFEDAELIFLNAVKNVLDPQEKRKIIGETFLIIRDNTVNKLNLNENEWLLAQGTLYPDIIESGCTKHADTIKTHHNRVEGVKQLLEKGLIIEPLKELYKDEVRIIGKKLHLPKKIINRHPFPGPGISVNLLCSNGKIRNIENFNKMKNDLKNISLNSFIKKDYNLTLLPVKSVGVQGDIRTYSYPALLEIPDFFNNFIGWKKIENISSYITNNIKDINRVVISLYKKNDCKLIKSYCTKDRLDMIRKVDTIMLNELKKSNWYKKIFQHLTINLPYAKDQDSCSIVLRPVFSEDVMTARFAHIDIKLLNKITKKINKLNFIDALYYDITNKPPATFGWE